MRLLAIGVALVALVVAMAMLFYKVNQLEDELEQSRKPCFERLAGVLAEAPQSAPQAR